MRVAFRTDASTTIGVGHAKRCLTLAEALQAAGASVCFVCRDHDGHLCDEIEQRGIQVLRLPRPGDGPHAAASWQDEASDTAQALAGAGERPEWLIFDHYGIDHRTETALRAAAERIMVIDDLADRVHDCDLLLDQNLVQALSTRYSDKVPAHCALLLGPQYCLLQPIYQELHDRTAPRAGRVRRVFVFFSGADPNNLTGRAVAALLRAAQREVELDVVITSSHPHADALRKQAAAHSNIHLHVDLPTLAPLMARADLAIGAGGVTSWERICLGLPTLAIMMAENQRAILEALDQHGLVRWLGTQQAISESELTAAVGAALQADLDPEWSLRCRQAVDGRGVSRVCAALCLSSATPLVARRALPTDEDQLREWANDPVTRANAFSQERIAEEAHAKWFRARLSQLDTCFIYVVETQDHVPVGQVRFDRKAQDWEIDYSLAPQFRGRGVGRPLLDAAMLALGGAGQDGFLVGHVKESNIPSQRVFEALGFQRQRSGSVLTYRKALGPR
jgi:UDP-2,4-diacetamido-2,4,6-trideoxy-beta-L-altropyranose hydrolase